MSRRNTPLLGLRGESHGRSPPILLVDNCVVPGFHQSFWWPIQEQSDAGTLRMINPVLSSKEGKETHRGYTKTYP